MGNPDGKMISTDVTPKAKALARVAVVAFLSLVVSAALPAYAKTGDSETATAPTDSEESLNSSGFKPFQALPSEPNHISDRVKLLHGSPYFILSNLNNFTYKPFHGENMWIGEFTVSNRGGRLEVVFNIGNDRVIAVAGYRVIAEPAQPTDIPPPAYVPTPQRVYVPRPQPPIAHEPGRAYTWKPNFNISVSFGGTYLNKDYWDPAGQQSTVSVTGDYNPGGWPVNLLLEYSYSSNATGGRAYYHEHIAYNDVEAQMSEFSVGARKYLIDTGVVRPYLSAGVSSVSADLLTPTGSRKAVTDSSSSLGYFGNGGIIFAVNRLYVGFDLKVLAGTSVKLLGASGDANYNRWSVLFGINF